MNYCVYHGNCSDGAGAAFAVQKYVPNLLCSPAHYDDKELPNFAPQSTIYIVDFCYTEDKLLKLLNDGHNLIVIDHHAGNKHFWENIFHERLEVYYDDAHSGAVLSYLYFNRGTDSKECVPPILQYIQDRDLWKFELPHSREITEAIYSFPQTPDGIAYAISEGTENLALIGEDLLRVKRKQVLAAVRESHYLSISGYRVISCNVPEFLASDVCAELNKSNPDIACAWYIRGDNIKYSLRSAKGGLDVAEIAKKHGGGGHPHAAGFYTPIKDLPCLY